MDTLSSANSHSSSTLEAATRRRAVTNISKIVTSLKNHATNAGLYDGKSGSFLLPHERHRAMRTEPYVGVSFEPNSMSSSCNSISASSTAKWRKRRRQRKQNRTQSSAVNDDPASRYPVPAMTQAQTEGRAGSLPVGHTPYNPEREELLPIGSMVVEDGDPLSQEIVPEPQSSIGTPSPGESAEMLMPHDPPSGVSTGEYGSSCDGRACGGECAERSELLSLRDEIGAQLREMRYLQEQNYMLLNASLQENFQATGALEGRLENYAARDTVLDSGPGHASRMLMWTILDAVSALLLWLITLLITKPYDAVKGALRSSQSSSKCASIPSTPRDGQNEFWASRKSWQLPDFVHEMSSPRSMTRRRSIQRFANLTTEN